MSSLLVTGGAGFIGSNFVRYWSKAFPRDRIVGLDLLTYPGNPANLADVASLPAVRCVRADIRDGAAIESLMRTEGTDIMVSFAAESHVDRSIEGLDAFISTNVVGTHTLPATARKLWLVERSVPPHRFQHVSTDEVYGSLGQEDAAFVESTAYAPNSPYSARKAASDHLVRAYHHTYGLDVTTSNCSNNYGPFHFPEKLIPLMITNVLRGLALPVYGDGRNVRDWLHVRDHCRAIKLVLRSGVPGEVYNVGGGAECQNIWLVQKVCSPIDAAFLADASLRERFPSAPAAQGRESASLITYVADRPRHDRRYPIDCRKIETRLRYRATVTLESGLRETIDWFVANQSWWCAVLDGSCKSFRFEQ